MNIKNYRIIAVLLLLFQINGHGQDLSFDALEDTYVSKSSSASNFGSDNELLIKGSTNGNFDRKSFMKFDISGSSAAFEQIVIKLIKSGGEELNEFQAYSTSTNWSENTMTWSNGPAYISEVGQGALRTGDTLFVDVTDYIKSKINNNQFLISLALSSTDIIGSPFAVFSKESTLAENHPNLIFYETQQIDLTENISLSNYVSSNMIIQRGQTFPFRGSGPVGETVTVEFVREATIFNASQVVNEAGEFNISIPAMEATSNPCNATVSIDGFPEKTLVLNNILIGDVWFAGGQSNMEKKVDHLLEADEVIADADNFTNIRAFRAEYNAIAAPTDQVKPNNANWIICDSDNIDKTSAVAYIFAKNVYQETGVPVGLMQAYVGGTEIETWISEDKITNDPKLQFIEDRLPSYDEDDDNYFQKYPSVNYNGMVNPLRFFPIKGFLFYQGESNVKRAPEYGILFKSLIQDYRSKWNLGDLPFYFVQLVNMGFASDRNYEVTPDDNTWQMLRQQQYLVAQNSGLVNIGMAVTIETNEEHLNPDINVRIHPRNKKPVGQRLARIALKENYAQDLIAYSPVVDSTYIVANELFIRMKQVGDGLKLRDGTTALTGFALANASGTFYEANATIEEPNLLSVISSDVSLPAYVAYGWSRDPLCTLDNSADLPASPFKIDLNENKAIGAIGDAFIENGTQSNLNFGSAIMLKVLSGSIDNSSYLKFDISDLLFTPFETAMLRLHVSAAQGIASISAFTTDNSWTESEINFNNAPTAAQELDTKSIASADAFYDWDITEALQEAINNEALFFNLVLKNNTNSLVAFTSREAAANLPELILNKNNVSLSIANFSEGISGFTVFPNPVKTGQLSIQPIRDFQTSEVKISLFNLLGQEFSTRSNFNENQYQVDVSSLEAGTYILNIALEGKQFHKKIIIQ